MVMWYLIFARFRAITESARLRLVYPKCIKGLRHAEVWDCLGYCGSWTFQQKQCFVWDAGYNELLLTLSTRKQYLSPRDDQLSNLHGLGQVCEIFYVLPHKPYRGARRPSFSIVISPPGMHSQCTLSLHIRCPIPEIPYDSRCFGDPVVIRA